MGEHLVTALASIATAIVGLAIIATLVSRNANTSGVLSSAGSAFSQSLAAAEGPVTGGSGLGSFGNFNNISPEFTVQ